MNYEDAQILFVGGKWNTVGGQPSKLAHKVYCQVRNKQTIVYNGGDFEQLERMVDDVTQDIIFWFADIPNNLTKLVGEIKKNNPKSILVTSKRGRDYTLGELVGHALKNKSNMFLAIDTTKDLRYLGRVLDPLGNQYVQTDDFDVLGKALKKRSKELLGFTRLSSTWLGSGFGVPKEEEFFKLIESYGDIFHNIIHGVTNPERFLGNASFRCEYGFPSFRKDNHIYVTRRNIDKRSIGENSFVPVAQGLPVRYTGPHKPSVDTPIQVELYDALPKINYMLHGHTYVHNGYMTGKAIPCGAIEEADEILKFVRPDMDSFLINLNGHGMLVGASNIDQLKSLKFIARPTPELQPGYMRE